MSESEFIDGMYVSRREDAPSFVLCDLGFKVEEFTAFLKKHVNDKGYVNASVLMSKQDKIYAKLNTFEPKTQEGENTKPSFDDKFDEDIPF